jgi:hypothetical protein
MGSPRGIAWQGARPSHWPGEGVITLIWTILGLLCIALGFVGELIDEKIIIGTLEWFVAAIAFNTLGGLPGVTKRRV